MRRRQRKRQNMKSFQKTLVVGAVAAALSFSACEPQRVPGAGRSSGSLALSKDDSKVFAVDTDNNILAVITPSTSEVRHIPVGKNPVRVVLGADETAFVSNRGDRSVSVIRAGELQESARIAVGVEPSGMSLTADGKTLLVVSATSIERPDVGTLTAIDTQTLEKKWEIPVGEEPRAVTVIAGNRALVSLYKAGEVVEVDLTQGQILSNRAGIYETANASRVSGGAGLGPSTYRSRAMTDLVTTAEGDRVFAPVVWAREDSIARRPTTSGGYYGGGGPCNVGAVASAGIITMDTQNTPTPQIDDLTSCSLGAANSGEKDFPASTMASRALDASPMQGPTAGVLDSSGEWLVVLNRESRNVAFMPAWKRSGPGINFESSGSSIHTVTDIGGHGADGLAVSGDFKRAYVYSQFDHRLEILERSGDSNTATVVNKGSIQVANDVMADRDVLVGRKLFFDARDERMSAKQTTVACSTCHLEGREDGHVWQFPDGARQTPSLAGRHLLATAPYHWSGEFSTLGAFNVHTITERMGGTGLNDALAGMLDSYIDSMPLAENPLRDSMQGEALAKGRAAFEKAECNSCHAGDLLTNNTNADVGSVRLSGKNPDNGPVVLDGFNVPSLLGLSRTAPYLHDGSEVTLEQRIFGAAGDKHGKTSLLNQTEKSELVAYLKSL